MVVLRPDEDLRELESLSLAINTMFCIREKVLLLDTVSFISHCLIFSCFIWLFVFESFEDNLAQLHIPGLGGSFSCMLPLAACFFVHFIQMIDMNLPYFCIQWDLCCYFLEKCRIFYCE